MIPVHSLKNISPQLRNRKWKFSGKWTAYLLRKMAKNTRFATNDRTRNTKFILDHVFKWKSRKMVISGCKMGPKRCTRRKFRKTWIRTWGNRSSASLKKSKMEFFRKVTGGFARKRCQKHQIRYKWSDEEQLCVPGAIICSEFGVLVIFWANTPVNFLKKSIFDFYREALDFLTHVREPPFSLPSIEPHVY